MKVLVIEDEKELSASIETYLKQENYLCETALTYDQAEEKINLYQYDCVIVDISLPDGNGWI
jgi:DNA-binding response OmpR family regulator